jgi:hypothetical protein
MMDMFIVYGLICRRKIFGLAKLSFLKLNKKRGDLNAVKDLLDGWANSDANR